MTRHFTSQQRIEQLRAIESAGFPLDQPVPVTPQMTFQQWLTARVRWAMTQATVRPALEAPGNLYRRTLTVIAVIGFVTGFAGVFSLLSPVRETLNIFWLLGVLLGLNLLTLLLWVTLIGLSRNHRQSLLGAVLEWLMGRLFVRRSRPSMRGASLAAWFLTAFAAPMEKWRLAMLSHYIWAWLLCGNLCGLLVAFTTRQFDFVWESTLLTPAAIAPVFELLAQPLAALHIPVPSEFQIMTTNAGTRRQWAWFVISCLGLYGLLPRLAALGWAKVALWLHERRWRLDLSLPEYIHLRHRFSELQHRFEVIDAEPAGSTSEPDEAAFSESVPPADALWVGLELGDAKPWQTHPGTLCSTLNDLDAVTRFMRDKAHAERATVICVDGSRLPDRGTVRNLRTLATGEAWLAVLAAPDLPGAKRQAWLRAAASAGIPQDRTVLTSQTS